LINGSYLFGKPIFKGQIRITDAAKSKTESASLAEGTSDASGNFTATLDLQKEHESLHETMAQFADLDFIASFTDPISRRTEQSRFSIRISRQPIHVYAIPAPDAIYISTSYADGTPAATIGQIEFVTGKLPFQTNRLGIGKAMPPQGLQSLNITATDSSGLSGTKSQSFWLSHRRRVQLESAKTLHSPGQSVRVKVTSTTGTTLQTLLINAISNDQFVTSKVVQLVNGKAEVDFPYQPEFQRLVTFVAWLPGQTEASEVGRTTVAFRDTSGLSLTIAPNRPTYKPGDQAKIQFQVNTQAGKPVDSALAVAVVDQAVLEQSRNESEFGSTYWLRCRECHYQGETEISGLRIEDLFRLPAATFNSPDMDLLAEALLAGLNVSLDSRRSESIAEPPQFASVQEQLKQLSLALNKHYENTLTFPQQRSSLDSILSATKLDLSDPWGVPYRVHYGYEGPNHVLSIHSAGPDKTHGTIDDFRAGEIRKPYFKKTEALIGSALKELLDLPATVAELEAHLANHGLLLKTTRDAWGTPVRPRVSSNFNIRHVDLNSAGPDKQFDSEDDVTLAHYSGPYFQAEEAKIRKALAAAPTPPESRDEFIALLERADLRVESLLDSWGNPYQLTSHIRSRYQDRVIYTNRQVYRGQPIRISNIIPVTERFIRFAIHSNGPDKHLNTRDDFDVFYIDIVIQQTSSSGSQPTTRVQQSGPGMIIGRITDATDAAVARTTVSLLQQGKVLSTLHSNALGEYQFHALPEGTYTIEASQNGFAMTQVTGIPVQAAATTEVDIQLAVGTIFETVEVSSTAPMLQTSAAAASGPSPATSTPRLRNYFPETLLWLPEAFTGSSGTYTTSIKLADSITSWKVAAFASSLDGLTA